jgi:hypothetical protein
LEEIPSNKLVYIPACWEGFLPESWILNQLVGRNPFRRVGVNNSSLGGVPPEKLIKPTRWEGFLQQAD